MAYEKDAIRASFLVGNKGGVRMEDRCDRLDEFLRKALLDETLLERTKITKEEMQSYLARQDLRVLAQGLRHLSDDQGRFQSPVVLPLLEEWLPWLTPQPIGGWPAFAYHYVLDQLFPEQAPHDEENTERASYYTGCFVFLQTMRALYQFERHVLPYDPRRDIAWVDKDEIRYYGYTKEYIQFHHLANNLYIYEMMRLGVDVLPFDTLGHISGVHYVAMYAARQLQVANVPVDLALISGAALAHDIGKYGCKKNEGRRVPYLHYYYTGRCCRHLGLPAIGHIAANHSVWDLELENLSVESLLLIYADFRVKSSRSADGVEIVHFYSLKEAFDVILSKLDNVDDTKRKRYCKVYEKLADFEAFMEEQGVITTLPGPFTVTPEWQPGKVQREQVLLEGNEVVAQLKYAAIDHNIRLMSMFRNDRDFGKLIEAARSERLWKNIRTYIGIFAEYSMYMTEHQKTMTLAFLYELLSHREGDIRLEAATLMGRIVANFNEIYTKELPDGVTLPDKDVTNVTLFAQYVDIIIYPELRFTEQHKVWIGYCLSSFVCAVLANGRESDIDSYLECLQHYYERTDYSEEQYSILLKCLVDMHDYPLSESFLQTVRPFVEPAMTASSLTLHVEGVQAARHIFPEYTTERYYHDLLQIMELPQDREAFAQKEGSLFLVDLKMGTHWSIKVANIELMARYVDACSDAGSVMHLGMHLTNLLKVSETVFVRRAAGETLLSIADSMTYAQRNELAVELFNGLEIGDVQISKYVPEFLGRMILKLQPQEVDEFITTIEQQIPTVHIPLASAMVHTVGIMLENFADFMAAFPDEAPVQENRLTRLLYTMIKAYAHYNRELSRDAFTYMGKYIFHSPIMTEDIKEFLFCHGYKKLLVLLSENPEGHLDFYSNAAVLNHIYRYMNDHLLERGDFPFVISPKACFYPGTFDPFSLGHKAVAKKIRDLGFDVYLAIDEFSWSKHTQPHLMRRKIMNMSIAGEDELYPFPEDIPVNIANPSDVKRLKEIFHHKDLYIAVGSDVVAYASAYKEAPQADSIHSVNHIIFSRETREGQVEGNEDISHAIQAKVLNLTLDKFYEDISSTKIRENIDLNRDIANLIDATAQQFIYDNNLYLREPAYKHVLEARELGMGAFKPRGAESLWPLCGVLWDVGYNTDILDKYIERQQVRTLYIDDAGKDRTMIGYAAVHRVGPMDLLREFGDADVADHIRRAADGSIACIGFLYGNDQSAITNVSQIVITEILTELIARDIAYAVYYPVDPAGYHQPTIEALERQGFVRISKDGAERPIYAVNMKAPVVIFRDVETIIKNPFNKNSRVQKAIQTAHNHLLETMKQIYPGKLLLSFNMSAVHYKIIHKVAAMNGVSTVGYIKKRRGPFMSVPFGKALSNVLVPNTVTKSLHIDKYFNRSASHFTIGETHHYASIGNQVKTIRSFNRPVILIDDLLHKGHRMRMLRPYLQEQGIEIKRVFAGVMTGQAMDMMTEQHLHAESAYFLPTLSVWLNERDCYPFIGGDSMDNAQNYSGYDNNPSINLVLPYVKPEFIGEGSVDAALLYSKTCLENAALIMETLQDVYQETYEKRLTLKRLGEVITQPRIPDIDVGVSFDENMDPTRFIANDMERLMRLRWGEK